MRSCGAALPFDEVSPWWSGGDPDWFFAELGQDPISRGFKPSAKPPVQGVWFSIGSCAPCLGPALTGVPRAVSTGTRR